MPETGSFARKLLVSECIGLSPAIIVHLVFAGGALALGPVALLARKGSRRHRSFGYAWVTLTLGAALSSVFIRDFRLPNLWGYTPIRLPTALTFFGVVSALIYVARKQVGAHRRTMDSGSRSRLLSWPE